MKTFPDPDIKTHQKIVRRSITDGPRGAADLSAAILSAVVAFLIGSLGGDEAANILRQWADAIEKGQRH